MFRELYNWEPTIRLADGLARTYRWIFDRMSAGAADRTLRSETSIRRFGRTAHRSLRMTWSARAGMSAIPTADPQEAPANVRYQGP
jgi:hypothetical protein